MGAVYEAEQDQPRRRVALKVIRAGWASPELIRRFQQEFHTLGRLHHPGIAQIYEAGTAETGFGSQPFFAMELIEGQPLGEYAETHKLDVRRRLALMIQICEAVEHAHQRGIIHRDLKPGNILVDQSGQPKILDFGLAKATDSDMEATRQTDMGQLLGTLPYMSPEQVLADPLALDTRSDVYALGVILYELLAGKLPYSLSRHLHEAVQTIREVDAAPLSSLSRVYRGDIETIVSKALEKDKERRYGSAAEFAADIRRYLEDLPIAAKPASTSYQLRKFVRRHKALVAGTVTVIFTLAAGVVVSTWEAVQARRAERMAAEQRDRANRNAQMAEKSRNLATKQAQLALNTIYQVITGTEEKLGHVAGTGPLRRELLETAMKNLDEISRTAVTSSSADRTMGVALQRMANFYNGIGATEKEVQALERSLEIFGRVMKAEPENDWVPFDAAVSYDSLGEIGRETEPDPSKTYGYYRESLKLREQLVQQKHQEEPSREGRVRALATSYVKLAVLTLSLHDPAKAMEYAQKAVATSSEVAKLPNADPNAVREALVAANRSLAEARLLVGDTAGARELYGRAEEAAREWMRANPLNAVSQVELARTELAIGDMELELGNAEAGLARNRNAESEFEALIRKDKENPELKWYDANARYGIGRALQSAGKQNEAKRYFEQCLSTYKALLRSDPTNIQRTIEVMLANAQLQREADTLAAGRAVERYAPRHTGKLFSAASAYALLARNSSNRSRNPDANGHQDRYARESFRLLTMASARGYRDLWTLQRCPELQSLRSYSEYDRLLGEVSKLTTAKQELH